MNLASQGHSLTTGYTYYPIPVHARAPHVPKYGHIGEKQRIVLVGATVRDQIVSCLSLRSQLELLSLGSSP